MAPSAQDFGDASDRHWCVLFHFGLAGPCDTEAASVVSDRPPVTVVVNGVFGQTRSSVIDKVRRGAHGDVNEMSAPDAQ